MAQGRFDSKWLEGLFFNYVEKEIVEKNGRKTEKAIPKKRPLREEDIPIIPNGPRAGERNWADYGDRVVIVTNNGKKYTVKKRAGQSKEKE